MSAHTNRLINETSPYLLQHAHNPVDWFPWGEEALQKAKKEDKPILVSIGYAACHWCHVMEKESFEDEETAALMNEHFVCIKIDREERPDLDHIYMDAVQAMTSSGGWPLNVFLTPDTKPFYGGTYFPPQPAHNRPSWKDVLTGVATAFGERKHEIESQAENLTEHLRKSNSFGAITSQNETAVSKATQDEIVSALLQAADKEKGGFGNAPKFPQTFSIQFLLRHHHFYKEENALAQALLSLDKMINGGIYDQIGGGFARYATDADWLIPHFEKMLYDNALLIAVLSEAYQLTKIERYKEVIEETVSFIQREMLSPEKGFYAALDADSEGEEGKFYVWQIEEVQKILGQEADWFCEYYGITENGNWEEKNILWVQEDFSAFCQRKKMDEASTKKKLQAAKEKLLLARSSRVRPLLDDKCLLGWNALMNTALSKAYSATQNESYRKLAVENMNFLLTHFYINNTFYHTWKTAEAKYPAFLDDLAYLIQALLELQQITANTDWLDRAEEITNLVLGNFTDEKELFLYYTPEHQKDVIIRKVEVYDGATPSGNAIMADNLLQLAILLNKPLWGERGRQMVFGLKSAVIKYPVSFGYWASILQKINIGIREIAVTGSAYKEELSKLLALYIPNKVVMAATSEKNYPLLQGKPHEEKTLFWLCTDYHCLTPVSSLNDFISQIYK